MLTPPTLTLDEDTSSEYYVALTSQPTATVTVSLTASNGVTLDVSSLSFKATDWSTQQKVTVTAADDADAADGAATITHAFAGGDYQGLSAVEMTVNIRDTDIRSVVVSTDSVTVAEGGSSSYTVVLTSQPTGAVTVTPSRTGSPDVTVSPSPLTFTTGNWFTPQTVTVSADHDLDASNDAARVSHGVSGADYADETAADVFVTVSDDETASSMVVLSVDKEGVDEDAGSSIVTVTATLNEAPRTVNTVVAVTVGDPNDSAMEGTDYETIGNLSLYIVPGTTSGTVSFTLTPTDNHLDEADKALTVDGSVTGLSVTATTVTIHDDDRTGVTVSETALTVTEEDTTGGSYTVVLDSQPAAGVVVTVAGHVGSEVSPNPTTLTFTSTNWGTAQEVTVTAAHDVDGNDDTVTLSHSAASSDGDYQGIAIDGVAVTVADNETPSTEVILAVDPEWASEGDALTSVRLTATLNEAPLSELTPVTVTVGAPGDSAVEGVDYATIGDLTLNIRAGQTSTFQSFQFRPVNTGIGEGDEFLSISGTTMVTSLTVIGTQLVVVDDEVHRGVTLSAVPGSVAENGGPMTVVVTATLNSLPYSIDTPVTVMVGASLDSATEGTDYTSVDDFTITVAAGSTSATGEFQLTPTNDIFGEGDETISISGEGAGPPAAVQGTEVTITDDETVSTVVALSVAPATVSESAAVTVVTVTARLNEAPRDVATVLSLSVGESSDTAVEGRDYATVGNLLLTINASQTTGTATFQLNPTDDDLDEDDESLTVDGSVTGLSVTAATVTITDDDTATVTVNPTTLSVTEGGSSSYTVVLTSQPTGNVTVTPSRTGSSDVTVSSSPLTFTPTNWSTARTVTVAAAQDTDALNDTATVAHAVSGADYATVTAASVTVTVADNETVDPLVTVRFTQSSHSVTEGHSITVKVKLSADPGRTVTIPIRKVNQGGATATDYSGVPRNMTFNSGTTEATFSFSATADTVIETSEVVRLSFGALPAGVQAGNIDATNVIIGDTVRVTFLAGTYIAYEGGDDAQVSVQLSDPAPGRISIPLTAQGGNGATSADWSGVPEELVFRRGDERKTFTVTAIDDAQNDSNELVLLSFRTLPVGVAAGDLDTAPVVLLSTETPAPSEPLVQPIQQSYCNNQASKIIVLDAIGVIGVAGESDFWKVELDPHCLYIIEVLGSESGFDVLNEDTYPGELTLHDADLVARWNADRTVRLGGFSHSGQRNSIAITRQTEASGVMQFEVRSGDGGTGTYQIKIRVNNVCGISPVTNRVIFPWGGGPDGYINDTRADTATTRSLDAHSHTDVIAQSDFLGDNWDSAPDEDWHRMVFRQGYTYTIEAWAADDVPVEHQATQLKILGIRDNNGDLVLGTSSGTGKRVSVVFEPQAAGTYYIAVGSGAADRTGAYMFSVQTVANNPVNQG